MLINYMLLFVTEVVSLTEITVCVTRKKLHGGKAPNYTIQGSLGGSYVFYVKHHVTGPATPLGLVSI